MRNISYISETLPTSVFMGTSHHFNLCCETAFLESLMQTFFLELKKMYTSNILQGYQHTVLKSWSNNPLRQKPQSVFAFLMVINAPQNKLGLIKPISFLSLLYQWVSSNKEFSIKNIKQGIFLIARSHLRLRASWTKWWVSY